MKKEYEKAYKIITFNCYYTFKPDFNYSIE